MTIETLLNMSPQDIDRMDKQSLSKVVVQLKSSANKRLARIQSLGNEMEDIPAYRQFKKAHSYAEKFESVKGKTAEELRTMYGELQEFLNYKTSTVSGWKKYQGKIYKAINTKLTGDEATAFWEDYNKFIESNLTLFAQYGSKQIQRMIYQSRKDALRNKEAWQDVEEKIRAMQQARLYEYIVELKGKWKVENGIRTFRDEKNKIRLRIDKNGKIIKRKRKDNQTETEEN